MTDMEFVCYVCDGTACTNDKYMDKSASPV